MTTVELLETFRRIKKWPNCPICLASLSCIFLLGCLPRDYVDKKEPTYDGRKLTEWLELSRPKPFQTRYILPPEAQTAVRNIGPKAIPILLGMVRSQKLPAGTAGQEHHMAIAGFEVLGHEGRDAISQLESLTSGADIKVRLTALQCLLYVTDDENLLVPLLSRLSHDVDMQMQFWAACALAIISPNALEAAGIVNPIEFIHAQSTGEN